MILNFFGKKVIVVGGSSGVGRQTAVEVVNNGGSAVIVGRSKERVDDAVTALSDRGDAWGITTELTSRAAVDELRHKLSETHSDATLLVNAAGFFTPTPFVDYDASLYDAYLDLNYALFFVTQTVVKGMIATAQGGSVVNVGSLWAHQAVGLTASSAYCMQKAGLHALTRNLASELAEHRIRVNAVAPAAVNTPLPEGVISTDPLDATLDTGAPLHPLGRVGTPGDLATSIAFLLSDESQCITGAILDVDDGYLAGRTGRSGTHTRLATHAGRRSSPAGVNAP